MKKYPTIPPDVETMEEKLRRFFNGMPDSPETYFTIEYVRGFELFGSYETWGNGWVIKSTDLIPERITIKHSSLEMGLYLWMEEYNKLKNKKHD